MAEANRERAMELFEEQRRKALIAESHRPYDPSIKRRCNDCNRYLTKARLKVQPFACRCTPCAEAIERNGFV